MSAISNFLSFLRSAIYAIDVRDGIADAIEQCYNDVNNPTLKTEALEAALQNKIDEGEMAALTIGDHTITAAKLAQGVIDNTLATSGAAADAKKTGDELTAIKADLDNLEPGLSDTAKTALLNCFQHAFFIDNNNDYYGALEAALGGVSVTELEASFSPSRNIYNIDTLDDIKKYLTVTATYSNGKSYVVDGYLLSGELNVGTNVITVTLNGISTTFNVNVIDIFAVSTWSTSSDIAQIADGQINIADSMSSGIQFVSNSEATGGSIRKHLASKIGILKYNNYDGTQLLDLYPIPIKNMAKSATINVSPSSCYSFIKMFRYDPTDDKYKGAGSALNWAQGNRTMDISTWSVDGVRRFLCINLKADNAGTGEFSVQPTITVTYGD